MKIQKYIKRKNSKKRVKNLFLVKKNGVVSEIQKFIVYSEKFQ